MIDIYKTSPLKGQLMCDSISILGRCELGIENLTLKKVISVLFVELYSNWHFFIASISLQHLQRSSICNVILKKKSFMIKNNKIYKINLYFPRIKLKFENLLKRGIRFYENLLLKSSWSRFCEWTVCNCKSDSNRFAFDQIYQTQKAIKILP